MSVDIRKIDLNLLVALQVLLEEKNVSRAAERLALTQPTVSGMLARLRVLFDEPLFVRTQHGMVPTPRAEALAPALDKLLTDARTLVEPEIFDPSTLQTNFQLSTSDYMQSTIIVPLIRTLRLEAPRVRVAVRNLKTSSLERMLASGELDLVVTARNFVDSALRTQFLYREEYICVVRESHPIRSTRASMKQFLNYDHVLVSPSQGHFTGPVDEALAAHGKKRRVVLSVPSFLILPEILETDNLIAFVPKRLLDGRAHSLRTVRPPVLVDGFDVVAAWHSRSHHDPAHQWLRSKLVAVSRP